MPDRVCIPVKENGRGKRSSSRKFTALPSIALEMAICGERKIAGDLAPSSEIATNMRFLEKGGFGRHDGPLEGDRGDEDPPASSTPEIRDDE